MHDHGRKVILEVAGPTVKLFLQDAPLTCQTVKFSNVQRVLVLTSNNCTKEILVYES